MIIWSYAEVTKLTSSCFIMEIPGPSEVTHTGMKHMWFRILQCGNNAEILKSFSLSQKQK